MSMEERDEAKMSLLEHLAELRNRLIYAMAAFILAFILCYWQSKVIFQFLNQPLADIFQGQTGRRMIYTGLTEAFFVYVKVSAWAAAFLSFPIIAIQLWKFIAPGLYKGERRAFLPFLLATPILFFLGGALVYYVIIPVAWRFFISFEIPSEAGALPVTLEAKVNEYLSLVMTLIFAFGLSFELPVLLTLLARAGLVTSAQLIAKWRYAVLGCFVFAAIVTPPDVISMTGLAVPMIGLYGLSIWGAKLVERQRARAVREAADADG